jgi:hypothetical protein
MIVTGAGSMESPPPANLLMYLNYGRLPDPASHVPYEDYADEAYKMNVNVTAYLLEAVSAAVVTRPGYWYALVMANTTGDAQVTARVWVSKTEAICNVVERAVFCSEVLAGAETLAFPDPEWRDRKAREEFQAMDDGQAGGACRAAFKGAICRRWFPQCNDRDLTLGICRKPCADMMGQCFPRYNPDYFCGRTLGGECTEIGLAGQAGGPIMSPAAVIPIAIFAVVSVAALVYFLVSRFRRSRGPIQNQNFQPLHEEER